MQYNTSDPIVWEGEVGMVVGPTALAAAQFQQPRRVYTDPG